MHSLPLFHYLQYHKTVMGFFMPQQQAAELAQAALQAPINNLIVFGILIALMIVLGLGLLAYKFTPMIIKQFQQLIDNNTKLTDLTEIVSNRAEAAQKTADKNAAEAVKTNVLLTEQNALLSDFKNYQKLNNDKTADVGLKVETLAATVSKNKDSIDALKVSVDTLIEQIKNLLEDQIACADTEERVKKLYDEILALVIQQQAKKTSEQPAVVIQDDAKPADGLAAAKDAA